MKRYSFLISMLLWFGIGIILSATFQCLPPVNQISLSLHDEFAEVNPKYPFDKINAETAPKILSTWTQNFLIPNPLISMSNNRSTGRDGEISYKRFILVEAVLFNDLTSKAYLFQECLNDSLDEQAAHQKHEDYKTTHRSNTHFRIHLNMETSFSEHALKLDNWVIYLIDSEGIIYEPTDLKESPILKDETSYQSRSSGRNYLRRHFSLDADLYFPKKTFTGKELFGEKNDRLILVFSRKKEDVAKVVWMFKDHTQTE